MFHLEVQNELIYYNINTPSTCYMFLKKLTGGCGIQIEQSIQATSLCIGQSLPMLVFYNNFEHCEI